jgi:sarcosine oxidase subunit beta
MSSRADRSQSTADAVVIGAGVIGSAIALELQRGGRRVVVVDKGDAVGGGSSSASSSIIRFSYSTRDGVLASWEAMFQWANWEEHLGYVDGPLCRFHRIGMLVLPGPDDDFTRMIGHFEELGVPYELWDDTRIAERYPALDLGSYHPPRWPSDPHFFDPARGRVSALHQPDAGFIDDPQLAAVNLMDAARHHGAEVLLRRAVTGVVRHGDRVGGVELSDGTTVSAPVVVNAAGPWSSSVNELAGVLDDMAVTTRALRQTIASCAASEQFSVASGGTVIADMDLGTYFRPQPGGSHLIGGVEAACDPLEWVDDPDASSLEPDPETFEALILRGARRVPSLEVPMRPQGLASHYDVTEDWVPIYDRSSLDGFYLAVGTSGNQFKNAPIVGVLMGGLIDACESGHDHDADPVRIPCRHSGHVLDLAQFSRRRALADTGANVWG